MKNFYEMTETELLSKYKLKAADSFKSKFDLFIFDHWLENKGSIDSTIINSLYFDKYMIREESINYYTSYYWQICEDEILTNNKTMKETRDALDDFKKTNKEKILELKQYYIQNFFKVFTFEEFKNLVYVPKENYKCFYCNISIEIINNLIDKGKIFKKQDTRGFTLEIDRIRPNEEYKKDNCVLCCYWCNNAKTDEFSGSEFKRIGKIIEEVWKSRNN